MNCSSSGMASPHCRPGAQERTIGSPGTGGDWSRGRCSGRGHAQTRTSVVADMARFERLTGCRPGEVCQLRPIDVDQSGEVWEYRPASHKTEHHNRDRVIFIGPQAQAVLLKYLARSATAYCFSPAESEQERHERYRPAGKPKFSQHRRSIGNPGVCDRLGTTIRRTATTGQFKGPARSPLGCPRNYEILDPT